MALAAPGGNSPADPGILSLGDGGTTRALGDNVYLRKRGTSMAAPHVAGVAAAMLAANPALSVGQLRDLLLRAARPFVVGTARDCTPGRCGAGMLDAGAAVSLAALSPAAPALAGEVTPAPGIGVWLAQADEGLRFFIDVRGGQPQVVVQFFDGAGQPQWAQARLDRDTDQAAYLGRWTRHRSGSALEGGSRPARPDLDLGALRLSLGTDGRWLLDSGGRQLTLRRTELADVGPAQGTGPGRTGLWWSVDRLGALFAIDARGARARLSVLDYTHGGAATWRTAELSQQADGHYAAPWSARPAPPPQA